MLYTHLTQNERYQISILDKAGHGQSAIARLMDRHKTTIERELQRNEKPNLMLSFHVFKMKRLLSKYKY